MRLGLSTYTYTWAIGVPGQLPLNPLSAYGLIDNAKSLKVECIQIADNMPLHEFSHEELLKFSNYALVSNVAVEVGTRGLTEENIKTYISIARTLFSPLLRIVIDSPGYAPSLEEAMKVLRNIVPVLKDNKIKLAIENHDRFKAAQFAFLVENSEPEWIGICLDSVNSMGAGEGIEEVVKTLAPYTINLHIKDFSIRRVSHKMGFIIEGTPAGKGMLDIPAIVNRINENNRCQSAILELWTPPEDTIDQTILKESLWAKDSIDYLKTVIKK
jgi:sugar phosphate isomerase/epimerase